MSGHSKWSNIKHRKQAVDAKRSKEFQKLTSEIRIATKQGIDPKKNPVLRNLLVKARSLNMPKVLIEKALHRIQDEQRAGISFWLAGYFNKKIAVIMEIQTLKKTFTMNLVKKFLQKTKFEFLPLNSMVYLFNYLLAFHVKNIDENQILILMEKFSPFDTKVTDNEHEETIFYFNDSQQAKAFHDYLINENYELTENYQTYAPILAHTEDNVVMVEEWTNLKAKLLSQDYCLKIVDDLSK